VREEAFLKRRQQLRDQIEYDRWLFLNQGPWLTPWPAASAGVARPHPLKPPETKPDPEGETAARGDAERSHDAREQADRPAGEPREPMPDWNNRWYYHGW
jgi:hypothetical protein